MGITYKNRVDITKLAKNIQDGAHSALDKQIQLAAKEIIKRSQSGKGVEGASLPGLSPAYAKYKEKVGRKPNADLTLTGALLKSIQSSVKVVNGKLVGLISFKDDTHPKAPRIPVSKLTERGKQRRKNAKPAAAGKRATVHVVARAMQARAKFFELSKAQRARLYRAIQKGIKR
jgi:hypothetical protein